MTHPRSFAPIVLAALSLAVAGCGGEPEAAKARDGAGPALLLGARDVAAADTAELISGVTISGTLKPAVDIHITSPVPEVLDEVLVREGQRVSKGQVLARFRTDALAPAAAGAEAQARVTAADRERMKNLLEAGAVSERETEGAEATYRAAQAQLALARKRLEEATVRAPVSGVIARRWVQAGDRVGDGDPLFRLVSNAELEFEATVPAEHAVRVRVGAPVLLSVSGVLATREGRVARINPTADAATRQVRLYVTVANRDGSLPGDLFATGRVVLERAPRALAVPRAAIRREGAGDAWVWVVAGGRAERRAVTVGVADESRDLVEVPAGLAPGDRVIVAPAEGLAAGKPVEVAGDSAAPAASPVR
jgi:RND family efflux transporter MFP subunit